MIVRWRKRGRGFAGKARCGVAIARSCRGFAVLMSEMVVITHVNFIHPKFDS